MSNGFEQQWRRLMLIIKKWQRKKEAGNEMGGMPLPPRRIHDPYIDKKTKNMIREFFRQSFHEN